MVERIDGRTLAEMFIAGANALESKKDWINDLNVFPVPDGDTGTNMTLTVMSAVKDLSETKLSEASIEDIGKKISMGTLKGARGNSGVIMSQLCRGFSKEINGMEALDKASFARAFDRAVATAYKAVMKPKEGTILTVARCASEKAFELAESKASLDEFFAGVLTCAEETLAITPELLPVLKEAGVVDSGGQGLVEFLKGALASYRGEAGSFSQEGANSSSDLNASDEKKFEYSVKFDILLSDVEKYPKHAEKFKSCLESLGSSLNIMLTGKTVKVSILSNEPGQIVKEAQVLGDLSDIDISNLIIDGEGKEESSDIASAQDEPRKEYGFVAVCAGEGIADVFKSLNVDSIIEGGQTMNPSTEDIVEAIDKINADNVFVLPNNGNVILTAKQAGLLCEGKNVCVIPTKTVPQGISSMMGFVPTLDAEGNEMSMNDASLVVKTLEVTHSIRGAEIDGFKIKKGDYMAIGDVGMLAVNKKLEKAVLDGIEALVDEDTALVTLYYGEGVKEASANAIAEFLAIKIPDADIEVIYGGQPVYYYIVSAE